MSDREVLPVSVDELIKDLDKYVGKGRLRLTPEEEKFIRACRDHVPPINYVRIADLWNNKLKWRKITADRVRHAYNHLLEK